MREVDKNDDGGRMALKAFAAGTGEARKGHGAWAVLVFLKGGGQLMQCGEVAPREYAWKDSWDESKGFEPRWAAGLEEPTAERGGFLGGCRALQFLLAHHDPSGEEPLRLVTSSEAFFCAASSWDLWKKNKAEGVANKDLIMITVGLMAALAKRKAKVELVYHAGGQAPRLPAAEERGQGRVAAAAAAALNSAIAKEKEKYLSRRYSFWR